MSGFSFSMLTYGCKMNQYESGLIRQKIIEAGGFEAKPSEAKYLFVNTCVVTNKTESKILKEMRKLKKRNPEVKIIFMGCFPQVYKEKLEELEYLDFLLDNSQKNLIEEFLKTHVPEARFSSGGHLFEVGGNKSRGFLKITDGCNRRCSYCVIWKARGPIVSQSFTQIVEGVEHLLSLGKKEVVLLGTQLAGYGKDRGESIIDLLEILEKHFLHQVKFRLSSLEPFELSLFEELLPFLQKGILCRHLHLAVQHLSDRVLENMYRGYKFEQIDRIMGKLSDIEDLSVGFDIITGFPGESEEDFCFLEEKLLSYKGLLSYLHVFPFSPKRGTPAAGFIKQIDGKRKQERVNRLFKISHQLRSIFYKKWIGRQLEIIVEEKKGDYWEGTSENFIKAIFKTTPSWVKKGKAIVEGQELEGYNTSLRLKAKLLD